MKRIHLVQLAGGKGLRAGGETPKQFRATGSGMLFSVSLWEFLKLPAELGKVVSITVTEAQKWDNVVKSILQPCSADGIKVLRAEPGSDRTGSTAQYGSAILTAPDPAGCGSAEVDLMRKRALVCSDCLMPRAFCVCSVMETESVSTRVTVVVHYSDVTRLSNTGRLVPAVLSNSEVLVRGTRGDPLDITRCLQPGFRNVVLFPAQNSLPLNSDFIQSLSQPLNLIVPDGNWNQAGKMEKREKPLAHLQRVHLEIDKPSRYRLRTAAHENWISTFEAVARSLGVVESSALQARLEAFFDIFVERVLYLKGKIPSQEVAGGITRKMIEQFHRENNDISFINSSNQNSD